MHNLQQIYRAIDQLSADEVRELYLYLIEQRMSFNDPIEAGAPSRSDKIPRTLGLHAQLGAAKMSEDFLDELPDSFWLGEE